MEDDTQFFVLFFCSIMVVIIVVAYLMTPYIGPTGPRRKYPEVDILRTRNLEQKQKILMPTTIPGYISVDSGVNWICYIYNPKEYNQTVAFSWSLAYGLDDIKNDVAFYSSLGNNVTVYSWRTPLECHFSFTINVDAPLSSIRRLEAAPPSFIILDVHSEVIE